MASRQRTEHRWTARGQLADFVLQAVVVRRVSQPAVEGLGRVFASSRDFVHLGQIQIELRLPWLHAQSALAQLFSLGNLLVRLRYDHALVRKIERVERLELDPFYLSYQGVIIGRAPV